MTTDHNTDGISWRTPPIPQRKPVLAAFVGVMAVGLLLRLFLLGSYSLSPGEASALLAAQDGTASPPLHALFHGVLGLWTRAGLDVNEWLVRLPSVLFGLGAIGAAYWLARDLFDERCAFAAALLVALSPALAASAQQLTPDSSVACTVLLPVIFLVRVTRAGSAGIPAGCVEDRGLWWILYAASVGTALYAAPYTIPVLAALNLWFLAAHMKAQRLLPWLGANVLGGVAYLPYTGFLANARLWRHVEWPPSTPSNVLAEFLRVSAAGFSHGPRTETLAAAVFLLVAAAGAALSFRKGWRTAVLPWLLTGLPLGLALRLVAKGVPVPATVLLPLTLPLLLVCGVALGAIPQARLRRCVYGGLALLLGGMSIYGQAGAPWRLRSPALEPRYGYKETLAYIAAHWREGDAIAIADAASLPPFLVYRRGGWPIAAVRYGASETAETAETARAPLETLSAAYTGPRSLHEIEPALRPYERVWFAFTAANRAQLPGAPARAKLWLNTHLFETDHQIFPGIELFRYERRLNGHWTRLASRDNDDGVSATLTYWHGRHSTYRQTREDTSVIPQPSEARRRRLLLRFEDNPGNAEAIVLPHGESAVEEGIALSNHGGDAIRVRLLIAASARLLDFTALVAQDPSSPVWRLEPMRNGAPPPGRWPLPVAAARLSRERETSAALRGGLDLDAGEYLVYLYQYVTAAHPNQDRARLTLTMRDAPIHEGIANAPGGHAGWRWTLAGPLSMKFRDDYAHIVLTAALPPTLQTASSECAYLAVAPRLERIGATAATDAFFWEKEVELGLGESRQWRIEHDARLVRLDVWALELAPEGGAHRIFRDSGGAGIPAGK